MRLRGLGLPFAFFVLILPFGAAFGFVSVALPYIASHRGVPVERIAAVVALAFVPHAWKFLWSPLLDATLSRRAWCALGIVLAAAGTVVATALPVTGPGLAALTAVIVASQVAVSFIGTSLDGLMALVVPEERKGRVAGWYQAGNFVGVGAGGGLTLKLFQLYSPSWIAGAILAALMILCALPLLLLPEPARERRGAPGAIASALLRDLWRTVRSRHGLTGLLICLSPVGAGAASNLFAAVAGLYRAGPTLVALVTGVAAGGVSAVGCLAGGLLADRMNRRLAYALAGVCTALVAFALVFAPATPSAYVIATLAYSFFNGVAYAAFTGFVLDTIGGGAAVATKYTVFASFANLAIAYMTRADGGAYHRWGLRGLFLTDALATIAGVVVLLLLVRLIGSRANGKARRRAGDVPLAS